MTMMNCVQLDPDVLPSVVLLVDRDATRLVSYSTTFETEGLWVATCIDPLEAIDAVRDVCPDLLVTNSFDDSEFDLVGTLKGDPQTQRLPVILLTDRTVQSGASARLADLCLQEPVSGERLVASSRLLIARSHELRKRSERTLTRAHTLVLKSGDVVKRRRVHTIRACPRCGQSLEFIERGRLLGVDYEYYRWCVRGCGLYCYERRAESWIKLA
jgi:DNA-binding response OmpR family regulator